MIDLGRFNVLGVNISAVDYDAAVEKIIHAAKHRVPFGVSALAVHGVMTGVMDSSHRHRLNHLELVVPDGQPVRWALNLLYKTGLTDRVYGPTLMLKTCEAAAREGLGLFLFGGDQVLVSDLQRELTKKYPELKISGALPSQFRTLSHVERDRLIDTIRSSGASIILVGLGCPRQEVWAYEFKDALRMPVLAVGAAFRFHAGHLDQAPGAMQQYGLEWLYRLTKEPFRLWKRYLFLNPYYVFLLVLQWTRLKRFDPNSTVPPTEEILYG